MLLSNRPTQLYNVLPNASARDDSSTIDHIRRPISFNRHALRLKEMEHDVQKLKSSGSSKSSCLIGTEDSTVEN